VFAFDDVEAIHFDPPGLHHSGEYRTGVHIRILVFPPTGNSLLVCCLGSETEDPAATGSSLILL
jgi:hypothetical protein